MTGRPSTPPPDPARALRTGGAVLRLVGPTGLTRAERHSLAALVAELGRLEESALAGPTATALDRVLDALSASAPVKRIRHELDGPSRPPAPSPDRAK
ncbi:hypothetical protein BJF78_22635 [Pseudonocardia sp. CNS-139]|nr:hypothetical protein BJF78_22635 [Pseudonocardia sp. CNS-139]